MAPVYDTKNELLIEKMRQRYVSLFTLFVMTAFFFSFLILFDLYSPSFRYLLVLTLIWQGAVLLRKRNDRRVEDYQLFIIILPLTIISPLFLLTMEGLNEIVEYNIILSVYAIMILLFLSLKKKLIVTLQILFLVEYLGIVALSDKISLSHYYESGGPILFLLIISLGISQYQKESGNEKLNLYREKLVQYKKLNQKHYEGDPILGLFSKSGGMKVLKQMMKWSERYKIPLTVCYMELYDSHDEYVNAITRGIFKRIRETDTLFRLGKQEMLLILPDCKKQNAIDIMKYIKNKLNDLNQDRCIKYGLADFQSKTTSSPNELIINANRASSIAR